MNEAFTTLVGWVATKPYYMVTSSSGVPFLSLRAGVTPRRFNKETAQWEDAPSTFFSVSCWRALAENVNASEFEVGDPIMVTGKLRVREYEQDGERRFTAEIEAITLGPDLTRGTATFRRMSKGAALTGGDLAEAAEIAERTGGLSTPARLHPAAETTDDDYTDYTEKAA